MEFFKFLQQVDKRNENIAATIITGENTGSKILLSNGEIVYTSNSSLDWKTVIDNIPENKKSQTITVEGDRIYIDFLRQSYNVVVCGAGHVSMAIIKMCKLLSLPVTVIDDRLIFANNAERAGADIVMCESFEEALNKIKGDSGTFFVIVTRGHRYDQICLEKIIQKDNAYIGMIGSKVRVRKVLEFLEQKGITRDKLNEIHTPIGLKIGAETPEEIAVSIMAEIIEVKNKKIGKSAFGNDLMEGILSENLLDIPKALVTIVSRKGSAPREVGTKMLILKDGTMIGTIGGGCVEAELRQKALSCLDLNESRLFKNDMTGAEAEDDGMVCGGIIEVFVEPISVK